MTKLALDAVMDPHIAQRRRQRIVIVKSLVRGMSEETIRRALAKLGESYLGFPGGPLNEAEILDIIRVASK